MAQQRASAIEHARRIRSAVLQRHGYDQDSEVPGIDSPGAIEDAASLATVNAHWGISSPIPVVGHAIVLFRRMLRIGLRWYINPIVEQQNAFNDAVVRALHDLQAENDKLRAELTDVKAKQQAE